MSRRRKGKAAPTKKNAVAARGAAGDANGAAGTKPAHQQPAQSPASAKASSTPHRHAEIFANAVAVLMRDPAYRELRLKDLETFLIPAILCGQCVVAQAPSGSNGAVIPVGVAIWATLSPEIDKRMSVIEGKPPVLSGKDFQSGDKVWMLALAGDRRALPRLLAQLTAGELKGREVKMRTTLRDGKKAVRVLAKAGA